MQGDTPRVILPDNHTLWDETDFFEVEATQSTKRKSLIVPKVQSMQEYILKHHKRLILAEINRQLSGGTLHKIAEQLNSNMRLSSSNCEFREMCFWRYNTYTLLADVHIDIHMATECQSHAFSLYCELWVDMSTKMSFTCGECGLLDEKPIRNMWMLSNYLVPILRKDEVEKGAETLLFRHCPDALNDLQEHNAYVLADRMGLKVARYPLFHQQTTLSTLFFDSGSVAIEQVDKNGDVLDIPQVIDIPAGTIVINTNAVHKDYCQLEIYHECIHYDWHFMFFRLQDMHNSDISILKTKRVVIHNDKTPANPLKWMEWQARRGSFGLMMPLKMMEPLVSKLWAEQSAMNYHAGTKYDRMARRIAREYELPKFRVRARLIQMGHIAAKGALNYVDGRYIDPFAFTISNGGGNYSFVIDKKNLLSVYEQNKAFREQLNCGTYIFVDGHVCINDAKYIHFTESGPRLTPWANAHVDQCCLRFLSIYEQCGIADYRFGVMNSDEEYNRHYVEFAQLKDNSSLQDKISVMSEVINELPVAFHDALRYLMKRAHVTIEELEEKAGISSRTISRLRTQERREYSLDQVIAICIALNLPPLLSRKMIEKAGFLFRQTKQHLVYQLILDCLFMDSIDEVQQYLVEAGCEKLRLGSLEQ